MNPTFNFKLSFPIAIGIKLVLLFIAFFSSTIFSSLPFGEGWGGAVFSQTTWQRQIKAEYASFSAISKANDSGIVVAHNVLVNNNSFNNVLSKFDKNGSLIWSKDLGKLPDKGLGGAVSKVTQAKNNDIFIIGGHSANVIKTDANGTILWSKSYGRYMDFALGDLRNQRASFFDMQETKDGAFILAGYTGNYGLQNNGGLPGTPPRDAEDIYLVKINTSGNVLWAKTYGRNPQVWPVGTFWEGDTALKRNEYAKSVAQTSDSGYVLAGFSEEPSLTYETSAFLLKVDKNGNLEWTKNYARIIPQTQSGYDLSRGEIQGEFNSVVSTLDGGYIATGEAYTGYVHEGDLVYGALVVKMDALGNVQWTKEYFRTGGGYHHFSNTGLLRNYGSALFGMSIYQVADGGYVLQTAEPWYENPGGYNPETQPIAILKINTVGDIQWARGFGLPRENTGIYASTYDRPHAHHTSALTESDGIAIVGTINDTDKVFIPPSDNYFLHVIKVDSLGKNSTCQNDITFIYTTPTLHLDVSSLTTLSNYTVIANVATSVDYTLAITDMCMNLPISSKFNADFRSLCLGDSTNFRNNSSAASFFSWNFGDPASGPENTSSLIAPKHKYSTSGSFTVTLTVTDASGNNPNTSTYTVTIIPTTGITLAAETTICSGDSALLVGKGAILNFGVGWEPNADIRIISSSDSVFASPAITTEYKFTGYNGGCYVSDSVIVTVIPTLALAISGNQTICEGTSANLTASGGTNYLWSNGETTSSVDLGISSSTSYTLMSYNQECVNIKIFTITVLPSFTVNAGENITIIKGKGVVLKGTTKGIATWSPSIGLDCINCLSPTANPDITTTYYITTKSTNGCESVDSVTVYVTNCDDDIKIPNGFSPNGDNVNDVLTISGGDCLETVTFTIYNRWGEMVFESSNLKDAWDGKYKSTLLDGGVFVYQLKGVMYTGDPIEKKGNISLIR